MANDVYTKGAEKMWKGEIDILTDTIKVALVENTYAQNLATDEFLSDLGANVLATQALSGRSVTGRVFDANDVTFPSVTAGDVSEGVVIYKDTGVSGTSPLLFYIDDITYFPATTSGADITVQWSNGAYKIASL